VKRRISDRRVDFILGAFDQVVEYSGPKRTAPVDFFMQATALTVYDAFNIPGGWKPAAIRAVLEAWLVNCPPKYLAEAHKGAKNELADLIETDDR
jgi:hypothetical protein